MSSIRIQTVRQALAALASLAITSVAFAQGIPDDRNINIIGVNPPTVQNGVPDLGLKQQNEPACAMKPSNPLQILCAFNDYRGVDNPLIGDAWEGYSYSINGGQTWFSDLLPGYPGDSQDIGLSFAADAQVAAAPGLALISYIAADRGEDAEGGLFLQRMPEVTREAGMPWEPEIAPIEVARGSADEFIDKPFMLLHPAPVGSGTVSVNLTLEGGPAVIDVPAARIHIAYTVFSGTVEDDNLMSKILVATSDDYGASWTTTVLANSTCELPGQGHCKDKGKGHKKGKGKGHSKRKDVIQSASLAAYGNNVCAVWRRFEDEDNPDAIMASCSADRGETFAAASELSVVPDFSAFDQGTTETSFRTNSYPVIAHDGSQFYAFWTSRKVTATPFFARIVYSTSVDGAAWTTPVMLEDVPNGHQFQVAVAAARGTIQLAWYDTRNNLFQANFVQDLPGDGIIPAEDSDKIIRNKGDMRTAQIVGGTPTSSVQVSRYLEGALEVDGIVEQLEFNFMNDRIFKQGTVPFDGDYPNVAAPTFRLEGGEWVSNTGPGAIEVPVDFLVSWTDNRDVRGNVWNDLVEPTLYTPADQAPAMTASGETEEADGPAGNQSDERFADLDDATESTVRADAEPDETMTYGVCVPGTNADRSRNQNIYSSVVRPGVSIDSPSASKPNGTIQRAHVVWVSNNESTQQTYTLTIDNQPPNAASSLATERASFLQVPVAPFTMPYDATNGLLTEIDVTIDPNSTTARTVYVTSLTPEPEINVSVSDGGSVVFGTIKLNGDILSPDVQNPDVQNPDVQNPDIQNAEVHNPDVQNVVITRVKNPDVQNPDVQNPDVQNPDVQNPDVQNPDVQNPDIQNPDVQNTSLDGSSTENPDVAYDPPLTPAEREEGYTDVTSEVTNNGNTTTSFNLDAFINGETAGLKTQLIASRTHVTETSRDCEQVKVVQNQIIFNKINPDLDLLAGDSDDGVFGDGSAYIAPGETIYVTLRVWGDPDLFEAERVGVEVKSQSCNSVDKTAGTTDCDPPVVTAAPTLVEFDFENATVGDQFPMASSAAGPISNAVFSGTKPEREVILFSRGNIYRSAFLFPLSSGGYFVYLKFTTAEPLELGSLKFFAGQNDTDQMDANFDVLLSPVNVAAPAEGDLRIPALDDYTKIGEFVAPYSFDLEMMDVDLTGNVLFPGTYYIALAASPNSGIDLGTTQLWVDDLQLQGLVADFFSATVDFEFIPPLALGASIAEVNSELERYGVQWEAQGGIFQLFDMGGFVPLTGAGIAFNSTGQFDGTHTARFVCPDGSGMLATVASASFDVADTEQVTVDASSFDINGVLLETASLPSPPTGTLSFTVGPIASIEITDSGGDGHLLDNLNYDGLECLPNTAMTFTETVITGDASILNGGSLVVANTMNLSNPVSITGPVTVNDVIFGIDQSGFVTQAGAAGWLTSSSDFSTDPLTNSWSLELDMVLSGNLFMPFGTTHGELTIPGLNIGTDYRLQLLFSNDLNTTANNIEVTVEGETWILDGWQLPPTPPPPDNKEAVNLIVDFTASSTSVVVEFDAGVGATSESGRAHLNGYALHGPNIIP